MVSGIAIPSGGGGLCQGGPTFTVRNVNLALPTRTEMFTSRDGFSPFGDGRDREHADHSIKRFPHFPRRRRDGHRSVGCAAADGFAAMRSIWNFYDLVRLDNHQFGTHVLIR